MSDSFLITIEDEQLSKVRRKRSNVDIFSFAADPLIQITMLFLIPNNIVSKKAVYLLTTLGYFKPHMVLFIIKVKLTRRVVGSRDASQRVEVGPVGDWSKYPAHLQAFQLGTRWPFSDDTWMFPLVWSRSNRKLHSYAPLKVFVSC